MSVLYIKGQHARKMNFGLTLQMNGSDKQVDKWFGHFGLKARLKAINRS